MLFMYSLTRPIGKHLFPDTMLDTLDSHAKNRHRLHEKHYRIDGVYDNVP